MERARAAKTTGLARYKPRIIPAAKQMATITKGLFVIGYYFYGS